MDINNYISKLEEHTSENSILIITHEGKMVRLFTPTVAKCILPVAEFIPGSYAEVTAFKISRDLKLVYRIENRSFYYFYFELIYRT